MAPAMKPYDLEDWIDYVRGLGEDADRQAMERHLKSGVDSSARDVRMLERVGEALRARSEGPPAVLSWAAKAIAGVRPPDVDNLPAIAVKLVAVDPPFLQDDAQRQAYLGARKLLYKGERFELDIWLEDPQGSRTSVVMGQVSLRDEKNEVAPVAGASVFIIEHGEVAASTLTNRFGEFHLETAPEGQIDLQILVRDHGRVDLSLPREEP